MAVTRLPGLLGESSPQHVRPRAASSSDPKGRQKKTKAEVCTITQMFPTLSPSLKREEGRKGLETPVHSGRSVPIQRKALKACRQQRACRGVSRCDS